MTVYIVLLGIIIGLAVIISCVGANTTRNKQIRKIMFLFLAFIMLFSVMALRGESVGTDNHLYCVIFDNIASGNEIESLNTSQGYILYNRIIALLFGNDSRNLIIISAFIITLIASIFIMKSSSNVYASVILYILLYFYLQSFNISRQFIAILLCAIAIKYAIDRKWKIYILLSILAILVHNTAVFIAIVGLVLGLIKKYTIKKVLIIWTVFLVGGLFIPLAIRIFTTIFPKYLVYFTTSSDLFEDTGSGGKILLILVYLCFTILGLYIFSKKKKELEEKEQDRQYMIYTTLIGLACIVGLEGAFISILIARVSLYFEIFTIIYIPMVIDNIGKRKEVWYTITILVFFIVFYALLLRNNSGVVPYVLYQ